MISAQTETDIGVEQIKISGKEMIENLSPEMKKQLGVYIQILQKR
jgi:hypothetical protein